MVETMIDAEAPPEVVLDYLAERGNLASWLSGVIEADASRITLVCLDRRLEFVGPSGLDRAARLVSVRAATPFRVAGRAWALPYGYGCRVVLRVEAEVGDFFGLPEPVVQTVARRRFAADLVALREQVQAAALSPAGSRRRRSPGPVPAPGLSPAAPA